MKTNEESDSSSLSSSPNTERKSDNVDVIAPSSPRQQHLHVVFLVDTTGSMGTYLLALKRALGQVCSLLHALYPDQNADVSVICYKDYGDGPRLLQKKIQKPYQELFNFCAALQPVGGGDMAEATKTALNCLSKLVKQWKNDTTVVFHYTDAPPHHARTNVSGVNRPKEKKALQNETLGYDWCKISRRFRKVQDRVKLHTIVPKDSPANRCGAAFHALLGELIVLPVVSADEITRTTMGILLQLTGQQSDATFQRVTFQRHEQVMTRLINYCGNRLNHQHKKEEQLYDEDNFAELNSAACCEPTFSDTPLNTLDLEWTIGNVYFPLPQIQKDVSKLRMQFRSNSVFRDSVFESMEQLIQPENVMALTTNDVFGRMWRLVCACRDDERLPALQAKMGNCVSSNKELSEEDLAKLKAWLEDSYDNSEAMNELIKIQQEDCQHFYVMDAFAAQDSVPDANGLRSLGRSPCPAALASVQKILSHIMLVGAAHDGNTDNLPVDDDGNLRYLPESLDDYQLFTMLPHLMQAGTQYSLKPAAVLAILCCKSSGSLLEARARRFLQSIRGKWLPPVERIDRAEIISYEFSALIANCHVEGAFTDEEQQFFRRLHEIWRYRRGRFENFELKTHISPTKPMLLPDKKTNCRRCHEWTSQTLMDSSAMCGICLWESEASGNVWKRPQQFEDYFVEKEESYIVECTACQVLYAVLGPADLNVPPKCHYCRGLDKSRRSRDGAPCRQCVRCKAKWCYPALQKTSKDAGDGYTCPVCVHDGTAVMTTSHQPSLNDLVEENPEWVKHIGFRPKGGSIVFSSAKLYNAVAHNRKPLFLEPSPGASVPPPLSFKGKQVLDEEALIQTVKERIASSDFKGACQLCFEEMAVEKLRLSCGSCTNRCCRDCLTSWYGQNSPGKLFVPSHDMCPFCRQRPRYQVLTEYNHDACGIVGQSRRKGAPLQLRVDWYYGWCQACWKVGYAVERSCAEGIPQLEDFNCEECVEKAQILNIAREATDGEEQTKLLMEHAKPCPGCQMATMHLGGCSHMTCAKCKVHWCWQCGEFKASSGAAVYDHMRSEHGGYGWVGEEAGDEFDD